jgi:predicted chitinase
MAKEEEIIKQVRLRGKISTDGKYWNEPKPDNLGIGDIKLTLYKSGRKEYFIKFEPVIYDIPPSPKDPPNSTGKNRAYDIAGLSYNFEPKPSNDIFKTTDDFVTKFISDININIKSLGDWLNPTKDYTTGLFAKYYSGLTQSGLPPFYEIVQPTFDPAVVPSHPEGYFDIWNKWVEDNLKPKPEKPVTTEPVFVDSKLKGDFKFNVEKKDTFVIVGPTSGSYSVAGDLKIITEPADWVFDNSGNPDDELDGEYVETQTNIEAEQLLELSQAIEISGELQGDLPADTTGSTLNVDETKINYNDPSFSGPQWKAFNIDTAVSLINKKPHKPSSKFVESLKKVLFFIKNDPDIKDLREGAYMLATAYAESGYSLQRWEADYACTGAGVPYPSSGPCSSATNYYRSTKGKKNYYTMGTDSKNQCYFGRGLIQLTGKANYEKYGKLIGVDLVSNGDLAMVPQNSYKVASVYMRGRTFKHVLANNLTQARKSVNGGTKGLEEVNGAYNSWVDVLKNSAPNA